MTEWEALLRTWQELDVPEGWRAEITEGGVTMTPPPGNGHHNIADQVHRAVNPFSDPVDGHYRRSEQVSFGEEIRLPEPFALVLATGKF